MPSIHTNAAALSALQTLRSVSSGMARTQNEISSGLRIETASDNAAYWSISTTMRSDNKAVAAVHDSLGLGSAMVDVAYSGLSATLDVLDDFKSKLVAASEPGVDRGKIQKELEQMKQQVHGIAESSSFNGVNWLNTDVEDLYQTEANKVSLVSSFNRDGSGGVSLGTTDLQLSAMALFNENGGGLLEADPRFLDTIGGMRYWVWYGEDRDPELTDYNLWGGGGAYQSFMFSGPLTFGAGDTTTFDITYDVDNPEDGIEPPFNPGETHTVTIDRDLIDDELPANGGVIKTWKEYISVLNSALDKAGVGNEAGFTSHVKWDRDLQDWVDYVDLIGLRSYESSGLDGASIAISNFASTVGSGGIGNFDTIYGSRGSDMYLPFKAFTVFNEVVVDFNFGVNAETRQHYTFDRDFVNATLERTDGRVGTAEDMAKLLNAVIDRPEIIIEANEQGYVVVKSDELTDRLSGGKTSIDFTQIRVNVEPLPMLNFDNIDVERAPTLLPEYIVYLDTAMERIIDGAAVLGSVQTRLEMQTEFTAGLMETIDTGVGRLVDADMEESSTRLKALEAQSQLSIQTLSIANSEPQAILQLFQ